MRHVHALNRRRGAASADRHDDLVDTVGDESFRRGFGIEQHGDARRGHGTLVPTRRAVHLVLARRHGGDAELAAEMVRLLVQRHVMTAQRGDARRLHARGAAADHRDLPRRPGGRDDTLVLVAVLRGHDASHRGDRHGHGLLDTAGVGCHEAFGTRAHGGDGVVEVAGVVGLADMEGVDAVGLEQFGEFHRLVDEQAATAELRVLGDDRQLVVDADVR